MNDKIHFWQSDEMRRRNKAYSNQMGTIYKTAFAKLDDGRVVRFDMSSYSKNSYEYIKDRGYLGTGTYGAVIEGELCNAR